MEKGRDSFTGEKHKLSKLTESDIRTIRMKYDTNQANQYELADEFSISRGHVSDIVLHKAWKHVES
jgi:hypothetical protein